LELFGKGDNIGWSGQLPGFVGPEGTGGTNTSLYFVDNEKNIVGLTDGLEFSEKFRRSYLSL
jgi:hypothetical protein